MFSFKETPTPCLIDIFIKNKKKNSSLHLHINVKEIKFLITLL